MQATARVEVVCPGGPCRAIIPGSRAAPGAARSGPEDDRAGIGGPGPGSDWRDDRPHDPSGPRRAPDPAAAGRAQRPRPPIEVAPRVRRLPPYLFGKINELKYHKRRAGDRRHRPGHGQPDRPARAVGHRQALRGGPRPAEPPLQRRHGHLQPPPRGRRRVREAVRRRRSTPTTRSSPTIGSKEGFSHMCLALLGPGDTAIVPAPTLPDPRLRRRPGLGQRHRARRPRPADSSSPNIARHLRAPVPQAQAADPQLPAQPDRRRSSTGRSSTRSWSWPRSTASSSSATSPTATSASTATRRRASCRRPGAKDVGVEFTTMSKGYNMAGWRRRLLPPATAEMLEALKTIKGYYDYGMFQAIQIAGDRRPAARRAGPAGAGRRVPEAPRRAGRRPAAGSAGRSTTPKAGMFVWAHDPRALAVADGLDRLRA